MKQQDTARKSGSEGELNIIDTFAGYRYQACFLIDPLRCSIRYVMGRFGSDIDGCPWRVLRGTVFKENKNVPRIFPLFLLVKLIASVGDLDKEVTRLGRSKTRYRFKLPHFEKYRLQDAFWEISKGLETLARYERDYFNIHLRKPKELKAEELKNANRYAKLNFLCAQDLLHCFDEAKNTNLNGILNTCFTESIKGESFSLSPFAIFGVDDVFICNWDKMAEKLRIHDTLTEEEIEDKLKKPRHSKFYLDPELALNETQIYKCMLCFARFAKSSQDLDTDDAESFRTVVQNFIRRECLPAPDFDRKAYAARLQLSLQEAVLKESDQSLHIERTFHLFIREAPERRDRAQGKPQKPKYILSANEQIIVLQGEAGQGKTTILEYLAWLSCERFISGQGQFPCPVFLRLGRSPANLYQAISAQITPKGQIDFDEVTCKEMLQSDSWLIFLDGYDDLDNVTGVNLQQQIGVLTGLSDDIRIIISTRPWLFPEKFPSVAFYCPQELQSDQDMVAYLKAHGIEKGTAQSTINGLSLSHATEILRNPLLLWGVALLLQADQKDIPTVPGALFKEVVESHFIAKWEKEKLRKQRKWPDITKDDIVYGLGHLAYWMIDTDHKPEITIGEVTDFLTEHFDGLKKEKPGTRADQVRDSSIYSSLLLRIDEDTVNFRHDMFRDYFAACRLRGMQAEAMFHHIQEDLLEYMKWDNVLVLLAGMFEENESDRFVDLLSHLDPIAPVLLARCTSAIRHSSVRSRTTVVRLLTHLAYNARSEIGEQAVCGLGELRCEEAVGPLLGIIQNRRFSTLMQLSCRSVARVGSKEAILPLIEVVRGLPAPERDLSGFGTIVAHDIERSVRLAVISLCSEQDVVPLLDVLRNSKNPMACYCAARILGGLNVKSALPLLIRIMRTSGDSLVQQGVIEAVGQLGCREAVDDLLQAAARARENGVWAAAIEAIAKVDPSKAVVPLVDALLAKKDEYIHNWVSSMLSEMDSPIVVAHLAQALGTSGDSYDRIMTVLATRNTEEAISAVLAAAHSEERSGAVISAVRALGRMQLREAIPVVRSLFGTAVSSNNEGIMVATIRTLGDLSAVETVDDLVNQYESTQSLAVRAAIIGALGRMRSPESAAFLASLVPKPGKKRQESLLVYVLEAIPHLGPDACRFEDALISLLRAEDDALLYEQIVDTLVAISGKKSVSVLIEMLQGTSMVGEDNRHKIRLLLAVLAVPALRCSEGLQAILQLTQRDREGTFMAEIVFQLSRFGAPEGMDVALEMVARSGRRLRASLMSVIRTGLQMAAVVAPEVWVNHIMLRLRAIYMATADQSERDELIEIIESVRRGAKRRLIRWLRGWYSREVLGGDTTG